MGGGTCFSCNQCGHKDTVCFGIGFLFPQLYQDVVEKIRKGKYGREWKQVFESEPGAAVDVEMQLYVCPECGTYKQDLNLSLYKPAPDADYIQEWILSGRKYDMDMKYVTPYILTKDYRQLKRYVHKCHACGKRMHQYRVGDRLACPKCKKGEMEPAGDILWD